MVKMIGIGGQYVGIIISLICGEQLVGDALKNELISSLQLVDGDEEEKLSIIHQVYGLLFDSVRTSWQKKVPAWIERDVFRLVNCIQWIDVNSYKVNRDYSIDSCTRVFVQNADLHLHGFNSADLGLGPYRNSVYSEFHFTKSAKFK